MKRIFATTALVAALGLGPAALAQTSPPVGGSTAKGNAPLKHVHTVNDGAAKPGANSFTEGQARQHILNSGYTDVTGLTKGQDGVWRGTATHNGSPVSVAMDFKGNVTEASVGSGPSGSAMTGGATAGGAGMEGGGGTTQGPAMAGSSGAGAAASMPSPPAHHHHRRRHHHGHGRCAQPGPNGAACSGVSTMQNGVSDRETRAIQSGAHP